MTIAEEIGAEPARAADSESDREAVSESWSSLSYVYPFFIYGEADESAALVCLLLLLSIQE